LIQGVRAQTVAFVGLESASAVLQAGLWESPQGRSNHAELALTGGQSRRFVIRLGTIRRAGKAVVVCSIQLEAAEEKFQPVLRGTLEFTARAAKNRTQIRLEGSAAVRLADGPTEVSTNAVRHIGNDYARQVLDEVVARIEGLAGNHVPQPMAVAK
jgi:hypothetical protein